MAASNHLQSHCSERQSRRADKMARTKYKHGPFSAITNRVHKRLYGKKTRLFLNNPQQWHKL